MTSVAPALRDAVGPGVLHAAGLRQAEAGFSACAWCDAKAAIRVKARLAVREMCLSMSTKCPLYGMWYAQE
jgi:hypothetical protein